MKTFASAALAFALSATPALAGGPAFHVGDFATELHMGYNCAEPDALIAVRRHGYTVIATLPIANDKYRYIARLEDKAPYFGITAQTTNCRVDVITDRADSTEPWCRYMPGLRNPCPMVMAP